MGDKVRPFILEREPENEIFAQLGTLSTFPDLPAQNNVTLCEINAQFQTALSPDMNNPVEADVFTPLTSNLLKITEQTLKPSISRKVPSVQGILGEDGLLVKCKEESRVKAVLDGLKDNGANGALNAMRKVGAPQFMVSSFIEFIKLYKRFGSSYEQLNQFFYPHRALSKTEIVELVSPVRSWRKSWVRALSWHPSYSVLALALPDDTIRVIPHELETISVLRNPEQQMISSLAWRPFASELAVGVENGVATWLVKSTGKSSFRLHQVQGHGPVTCVNYNETGRLLVSASPFDSNMIIWNTNSWTPTKVRTGGGGIPRAIWCNNNIFCNTASSLFRIWTYGERITSKKWNTAGKRVEAFAWSPCGSIVLFVNDRILYSLNLKPGQIELISETFEPTVMPLFNLKVCHIGQSKSDLRYKVGGRVIQMEWDISGSRLAILFSDSELIAVFRVERKANTILVPIGFIRGHDGDLPIGIAFQKNFNDGAVLTIAWSSKRIQYFPMIFSEPSRNPNLITQHPKFHLKHQLSGLTQMAGISSPEVIERGKVSVDLGPSFSHVDFQKQSSVTPSKMKGGDASWNVQEETKTTPSRVKLFSL